MTVATGELCTLSTVIHSNSQKEKEAKRKRTGRRRLLSSNQTATTRHITKHATLHEDAVGAHIALQSMLTAAGAAATAAVPGGSVEGLLATNFTSETNQQVGQGLNQVKSLDSINVRERTAIRVFVLHRFIRPGTGN
jgi:hypothetical protein